MFRYARANNEVAFSAVDVCLKDIPACTKRSIRGYWEESSTQKTKGKRLLVNESCRTRKLDEKEFRSAKDRVEKRMTRAKRAGHHPKLSGQRPKRAASGMLKGLKSHE